MPNEAKSAPSPQSFETGPTLVSDFDGTVTARDFFDLIRSTLRPEGARDHWDDFLAGRITHFDALRNTYGDVTDGESALLSIVDRMEPDPDLGREVTALRAAGWRVVVASAGCDWYIRQILGRAGVADAVTLHSNPGRIEGGRLIMDRPPPDHPFWSHEVGIDKAAIVRAALEAGGPVAFCGDGLTDVPPALIVPPLRRFARGAMAEELGRRGEFFRPFDRWADVSQALLGRKVGTDSGGS